MTTHDKDHGNHSITIDDLLSPLGVPPDELSLISPDKRNLLMSELRRRYGEYAPAIEMILKQIGEKNGDLKALIDERRQITRALAILNEIGITENEF